MQHPRSLFLFGLLCSLFAHTGVLWAASFTLDASSQKLNSQTITDTAVVLAGGITEQTTAGLFDDSRTDTYSVLTRTSAAQATTISSDGELLSMSGTGSGSTQRYYTAGASYTHIGLSSMSVTITPLVPLFLDYDLTLVAGSSSWGQRALFTVTSGASTIFSLSGSLSDVGQVYLATGQSYVISVEAGGATALTNAAHNQSSSFDATLSLYAVPEPGSAAASFLALGGGLVALRRRRKVQG